MSNEHLPAILWTGTVFFLHFAVAGRAILRPRRQPASRLAWVIVILALPLAGMIAYLLTGETGVGRRRSDRRKRIFQDIAAMPSPPGWEAWTAAPMPAHHAQLFRGSQQGDHFAPVGGNSARLAADADAAISALVEDIDRATHHVHLIFYLWLGDHNGLKVAGALQRAAARGVTCRAMADGVGSRAFIRSSHWAAMREAGVKTAEALPVGNLLLRVLNGRIDLRNHRKIAVIDNRITYCGSQNCADAAFLIKARFAPWVDVLARFEGPIARQSQQLFIADWMTEVDEDLRGLLLEPLPAFEPGFAAQVIGTGPTSQYPAMPEVFAGLMYAAQKSLFITTPYYAPDEAIHAALCACARRGVETTILFPARNDSWIVAAASRSCYASLLEAGVRIHEYEGGLLHAKTLTLDGEISLIGSANMDRRSFDLNYENNILVRDAAFTATLHRRQLEFMARCRTVTTAEVESWSALQRLKNNTLAMMSPLV